LKKADATETRVINTNFLCLPSPSVLVKVAFADCSILHAYESAAVSLFAHLFSILEND